MANHIDQSNILVIRPKLKMGTDQIDFLILDSGGGEQLMDRQDVVAGASCFADLKPIILKLLGEAPSLVLVDLGQVTWMNSTSLGDLVDLLVVVRNALVQVLEFLVEPVQLGAKALTETVLGLLEDLR